MRVAEYHLLAIKYQGGYKYRLPTTYRVPSTGKHVRGGKGEGCRVPPIDWPFSIYTIYTIIYYIYYSWVPNVG